MLAGRRRFFVKNKEFRTPILVPSFSSKGFQKDLSQIIQFTSMVITDETLVSAYDVHYGNIKESDFGFPTLIFLDSGGYEAGIDADFSDVQKRPHVPLDWKKSYFDSVLSNWTFAVPTVVIAYDHPTRRYEISRQLSIAKKLSVEYPNAPIEVLLKPQPGEKFLNTQAIIDERETLAEFPIVGVTEKEIGRSLFERMENIAKIRQALSAVEAETSIHVFGSLDPISTPLYFLSGADIFDGLTWLRYGFVDTGAMYKHNFGALKLPITSTDDIVNGRIWNMNYYFMEELQGAMRQFLQNEDFTVFKEHSDFFRRSYERLCESIGEQ